MRPHVPDAALRPTDVPAEDAPWSEVVAFGHGYHAYKVAGSLQAVASRTLELHDAWAEDGSLPRALPPLRLALFHTVRALDHGGEADEETVRWARALVAAIAEAVVHTTDGAGR